MNGVIVIQDAEGWSRCPGAYAPGEGDVFWSGPVLSSEVLDRLREAHGRFAGPVFDETAAKVFIRRYNDLMAEIAADNPGPLFWATDTAAKNRFSSPLPDRLEQLAATAELLETYPQTRVFLFLPDPAVASAAARLCARQGRPCVMLGQSSPVERALQKAARMVRKTGGHFYQALRMWGRMLRARRAFRDGRPRGDGDAPWYVLKTFTYNQSFSSDGHYLDAFFGDLPRFLASRTRLLILADVLGNYRRALEGMRACREYEIVPLELFLRGRDILASLRDVLAARLSWPRPLEFYGIDVRDLLRDTLQPLGADIRLYHYLHRAAVRNLVRRFSVGTFTLTYENYPWERMAITALRDHAPSAKIIGYQHTAVPFSHINMFVSERERHRAPLPDRILTNGVESLRVMRQAGAYPDGMLAESAALRFAGLADEAPLSVVQPPLRLLLALEGSPEAAEVIRYLLAEKAAGLAAAVRIRPHPLLPWADFERRFQFHLAEGVEISKGDLKSDLAWADAVLYWSTSVAMAALAAGKPVIHFDRRCLLSYDPLIGCPHLKWVVHEPGQLRAALAQITALTPNQRTEAAGKAQAYLRRCFTPVDAQRMSLFLPCGR